MATQAITTGVQSPTTAGAVTGTLDTSALTGDWVIKLRIPALAAGKRAVIALQDTANATPFSDAVTQAVIQVVGRITANSEKQFSIAKRDLPAIRTGSANCALRFNILSIDSSPGFSMQAWLDN